MIMKKYKIFNFLWILALTVGAFSFAVQAQTENAKESPLPNLSLNLVSGDKWNLHDERGNIVMLNFWATWCAPCREEIPVLVKLSDKHKSKGVKVVGVSVDSENLDGIKEFIKDYKMKYSVVLTVPGTHLSQKETVPMTLLIDENRVLSKKYVGAVDGSIFEKDITSLLNKKQNKKRNSK